MKEALRESKVIFDPEKHEYTLNGRQLSGVTPIVAWLFPETYKGIPQQVLDKAADRGSMIHAKVELANSMSIVDDEIISQYMELKEQKGLKTVCNEYLVSDETDIASCIDDVYDENGDDSLGDIKCTSKVHIPNVTLQLSIYAWLYEMQNPTRKVKSLYCVWLPRPQYGQPDIFLLDRVPSDVCEKIVTDYIKGESNEVSLVLLKKSGFEHEDEHKRVEGEVPEAVQDLIDELVTVKKQLDIYTQREKEIKEQLLATMVARGEDKWQSDVIQVSKVAASVSVSVDSKALKEKYPEVFDECKKESKRKEYVTYKLI